MMAFEPAVLEGGYVTDLLLTIAFDGEAWGEAHIGELRTVLQIHVHERANKKSGSILGRRDVENVNVKHVVLS